MRCVDGWGKSLLYSDGARVYTAGGGGECLEGLCELRNNYGGLGDKLWMTGWPGECPTIE